MKFPIPDPALARHIAVLCDPAPGWERRDPYRGSEICSVALRSDEAHAIDPVEIRAMSEAAPDKTLQQIIDGWRCDRTHLEKRT